MTDDSTTHPALRNLQKTQPAEAAAWQRELDYVRHVSAAGPKVPVQTVAGILGEKIMLTVLTLELLGIALYGFWIWVVNR